jgi:hypothetical protein
MTSASGNTSAAAGTSTRTRVSSAATNPTVSSAAAPTGTTSSTAACPAGSTVSSASPIATLLDFRINSTGLIEAKEWGNVAVKQGIGRTVIAAS